MQVLEAVALRIPRAESGWIRVAVDGIDGAGKTTFANELGEVLTTAGRPVIRASVDDFHNVRRLRYRRGRDSWEGYWLDAFNYALLDSALLQPLGPEGSGWYRAAVHDLGTDVPLVLPRTRAPIGAVLLLDGVFLHRDELDGLWDLSVFLDISFAVRATRLEDRDGSDPHSSALGAQRYVKAQRHYLSTYEPHHRADLHIDKNDLELPALLGG